MTKQKFKLVYVKNGALYGSYSGIPGEKDVVLITRAALEGLESPIPEGYIIPEGILEVIKNGAVDVAKYAKVSVNVPIPEGYIIPEGQVLITENGEVDVAGKASVLVQVDIPEGYLKPTGSLNITENGEGINIRELEFVNVNVPSVQPSGTLEIALNGDYDVSNYANASVSVHGSFEPNYLYPTDEEGMLLNGQALEYNSSYIYYKEYGDLHGQEFDEYHIYYKEYDELHSCQPSAGSVYFFDDAVPYSIPVESGYLYYYTANMCNPISPCFESSVSDGDVYIGDTTTEALLRQPAFPQDSATLMYVVADDEDPQDGDYYRFSSETGCQPLVKAYFRTDTLYWWPSNGGDPISNSIDSETPYLVSAGSNAILDAQVGNLEVGQEATVELDGKTYTVTRTA